MDGVDAESQSRLALIETANIYIFKKTTTMTTMAVARKVSMMRLSEQRARVNWFPLEREKKGMGKKLQFSVHRAIVQTLYDARCDDDYYSSVFGC